MLGNFDTSEFLTCLSLLEQAHSQCSFNQVLDTNKYTCILLEKQAGNMMLYTIQRNKEFAIPVYAEVKDCYS